MTQALRLVFNRCPFRGISMEAEKTDFDAVVVGAGVEGSATAHFLSSNGQKTLLLEQFCLPHVRGSSLGQSRIIRKVYKKKFYTEMMHEAYDAWRHLQEKTGTELYIKTGMLLFAQEGAAVARAAEQALIDANSPYRKLSSEDISREYGNAFSFPSGTIALYDDLAGILKADKCLASLHQMFIQYGGVIHDGEAVTEIIPGTIVTIVTTRRTYRAKSVVIAAGPWSSKLLQPLGLSLPLKPIRISVLYWKSKAKGIFEAEHFPTWCVYDSKRCDVYGIPLGEYGDLMKICNHSGPDIDPDYRDLVGVDENSVKKISDFIKSHMVMIEDTPSITETCMYTMTPDEDFILDKHPDWGNIIIGAGFSGHGFKLAPVVGKLLGELAMKRTPSYDLTPFLMRRFSPEIPQKPLSRL